MASKEFPCVKKRQSESSRAKTQQRNRRKQCIFKKAKEFCLECESDIFVAIRVRKTGQIYILDSSTQNQWLKDLSNLESYYPRPIRELVDRVTQLDDFQSDEPGETPSPRHEK